MSITSLEDYNTLMDRINIGILGTGDVGRTLAAGFAGAGHDVKLGGREPDRPELAEWGNENRIDVVDLAAAAAHGDVVVLATSWEGAENALRLAQPGLGGKVMIDVTNPLTFAGGLRLTIGFDDSGGEQVQRWAPTALVVKAFNTVGWELMVRPELEAGPGTMFLAGDDPEAKSIASGLAADLGWATHDCGGIEAARLTEPMALIWIQHAITSGTRRHAFRLIGTPG